MRMGKGLGSVTRALAILVSAHSFALLHAQDTRTVTEPKIPPVCTWIPAKLHSVDGNLAPADESKLDTARIQAALDACKPGQAVELHLGSATPGNLNAFLTGPLDLREGVTLLIVKARHPLRLPRPPRLRNP